MILNMNQLRAFHTAAMLKSITQAAQELMVTPPAISMQIKQLEENLAGLRSGPLSDAEMAFVKTFGDFVYRKKGYFMQPKEKTSK